MKIRRGDILYADLGGQYQGSMQGGMRPVVVKMAFNPEGLSFEEQFEKMLLGFS